jgi:uncharacterized membrane protein
MGVRKVAAGIGMVSAPQRSVGFLTKAGNDLVELARLRKVAQGKATNRNRAAAGIAALAGVTVLGAICAKRLSAAGSVADHSVRHTASLAVNKSSEECYQFWRNEQNLPVVFQRLKQVNSLVQGRSEWVAAGPSGRERKWTVEITEDVPNEQITWRSVEGTPEHSGSVRFETVGGDRGCIIRLHMQYEVPAGGIAWLAKFLGPDPALRLRKALMRSKQLLEAGEIATTAGQPAARSASTTWIDRVARI